MTHDNGMDNPTDGIGSEFADIINEIARRCYQVSTRSGFHSDHELITELLKQHDYDSSLEWLEATAEQAEIARMHSELSEGLESVRKNPNRPDEHLPQFDNRTVEYADCIIRIFDTCAKRNLPLGEALVAKIRYNASRPYKHGKNS